MEDLHWVDPTTLEFLSLLVDQGPTARILALVYLSSGLQPALDGALASHPGDAAALTASASDGDDRPDGSRKALPPEVIEQVVAKTDGVPLFVEELMKMVLESGLLQERAGRYEADRSPAPAGDPHPRCTTP